MKIGDYMNSEDNLNLFINDLYNEIYNNFTVTKINYQSLEKKVFSLLKQSLKTHQYEIEIGSYKINFNPQNILVSYETLSTYLEISNTDIHEENEIIDNIVYYAIEEETQKNVEHIPEKSVLKTSTSVIKYDSNYQENIYIEFINCANKDFKYYLKDSNDITYIGENSIIISKEFSLNDNRLDVNNYFKVSIIPIKYNQETNNFSVVTTTQTKKQYRTIFPNTDYQKEIIKHIYNSIVKFYSNYI